MNAAASTSGRGRRVLAAVLLTVMSAGVLSACLGPYDPDPTGNAPIGHLDSATASGTAVRLRGWAIDPNTTSPIYVTMGHLGVITKHLANLPRPDVAKVHPKYGANHGFDITTPTTGPTASTADVCIWVENVGAGNSDRLLGCVKVALRSDDADGRFESLTAVNPRLVRATGWALDPETTNPVKIRYSVDGGTPVETLANRARADITQKTGIAGSHGFVVDIPVSVGSHRVCITAIGTGRGKNADLGCRSIVTESVTPIGPGGDLLSVARVGPGPDHPLNGTDRDAGVSTVLSDGSVLWLFGDTSGWNPDGTLKYFLNNTAAWAPASNPTATVDGVNGAQPHQFVYTSGPFSQACKPNWKAAMWPMSAVSISGTNRVVVLMGNVCMGGAWEMESRGVSVVEWFYDPSNPPINRAIQGRVINQNLFPAGEEYGTAAFFDGTYIKAYECGRPGDDGKIHFPDDPAYGPCTVARVVPERVAERSAWQFWAGEDAPESWSSNIADAAPMTVPGKDPVGGAGADRQMPVAAFSVHRDSISGKFLMTYSPWPGLTSSVFVRVADTDTGPWSSPIEFQLPGCLDSARGEGRYCYAAIAQPALSTSSRLGIGYFDQLIALNPPRGGYLAGTVARPGSLLGR